MPENEVFKKLRLRPGMRVAVLDAPATYQTVLAELPEGTVAEKALEGQFDFIHAFVTRRAQAEALAPALGAALKPGGLLWISYPKGKALSPDVNRDILFAALLPLGLQAVANVAIDEVWSALRFKPV